MARYTYDANDTKIFWELKEKRINSSDEFSSIAASIALDFYFFFCRVSLDRLGPTPYRVAPNVLIFSTNNVNCFEQFRGHSGENWRGCVITREHFHPLL